MKCVHCGQWKKDHKGGKLMCATGGRGAATFVYEPRHKGIGSHGGGKMHLTEQQNRAFQEKDPDYVTKLMTPANMPGRTDHSLRHALKISCSMCGDSDGYVGSHTRLCDPCWELKKRLEDKRRVAVFQIARVELVPGDTLLWLPTTPTTRLLINGVDIGVTLGAGQGIEKTIREALKRKVTV